jgi:hypothetical protein
MKILMKRVLFCSILVLLFFGYTSQGRDTRTITFTEKVVIMSLDDNCSIYKQCTHVRGHESDSEYIIPLKTLVGLAENQILVSVTEMEIVPGTRNLLIRRSLL